MSRRNTRCPACTETLDLGNNLSVVPRLRLLLTFFRSDLSVKPVDECKIKRSLLEFLKRPNSDAGEVSDEDLEVHRYTDTKKRKRDDPVAHGTLQLYDLRAVQRKLAVDDGKSLEEIYEQWMQGIIILMDGIELNLEGTKFRLSVEVPLSDRFDNVRKSWEEFYAGSNLRGTKRQPDTIIITGIPSRWLAEPRVSSKASMLVTHTIFSALGKIRNLDITGDDDPRKTKESSGGIMPNLYCKVRIQFEKFEDFCQALKVLCGRSLQKLGSHLKVNYEVTWDKDGFFRNIQQEVPEQTKQDASRILHLNHLRNDVPYHNAQSMHSGSDSARRRRFQD